MSQGPKAPVILCVEDDPQLLADLVDELRRDGYIAHAAADADEAYDLAVTEQPDLILCDISMPGADGYVVLETMRSLHPNLFDVPFIFLSALAEPSQVVLGKRLGADDYLTKPVDYDLLLATVNARLSQVDRIRRGFAAEVDALRESMTETLLIKVRDSFRIVAAEFDRMAAGLVQLDALGMVRDSNATALGMFEEGDGVAIVGGRLVAVGSRQATELRRAMAKATLCPKEDRTIVIQRDFRQALLVRIICAAVASGPGKTDLVVILVDPERMPSLSPGITRELFGLTPAEAKIAVAVAEGARPEEISSRFEIAQSTINFHLNNVFRKTGTSRQIDLVALLIRTAVSGP